MRARFVLALSKAERDAYFNGSTDADGKRKERGIIVVRGLQGAEKLRGYMERLLKARRR